MANTHDPEELLRALLTPEPPPIRVPWEDAPEGVLRGLEAAAVPPIRMPWVATGRRRSAGWTVALALAAGLLLGWLGHATLARPPEPVVVAPPAPPVPEAPEQAPSVVPPPTPVVAEAPRPSRALPGPSPETPSSLADAQTPATVPVLEDAGDPAEEDVREDAGEFVADATDYTPRGSGATAHLGLDLRVQRAGTATIVRLVPAAPPQPGDTLYFRASSNLRIVAYLSVDEVGTPRALGRYALEPGQGLLGASDANATAFPLDHAGSYTFRLSADELVCGDGCATRTVEVR